jgi:hypothetical protein
MRGLPAGGVVLIFKYQTREYTPTSLSSDGQKDDDRDDPQ